MRVSPTPIIIVGASAFGRQIAEYVEDAGHSVAGFIDDDPGVEAPRGYRVLGTTKDLDASGHAQFLIAVADPKGRKDIALRLAVQGATPASFVHPTAYVSAEAQIGQGTVICPLGHVGAGARLGEHVLINTFAFVGHDASVGSYSALMGFACVNGSSTLGEGVYVGTHASVNPNRRVGEWAKVASGSIVYQDMADRMLISGNPAEALPLLQLNQR